MSGGERGKPGSQPEVETAAMHIDLVYLNRLDVRNKGWQVAGRL